MIYFGDALEKVSKYYILRLLPVIYDTISFCADFTLCALESAFVRKRTYRFLALDIHRKIHPPGGAGEYRNTWVLVIWSHLR